MRMIININLSHLIQLKSVLEQYESVYMLGCRENYMAEEKTSILLSDVSVEGDLVEKDKIIVDAKVMGNIKADNIETHLNSNVKGNVVSKNVLLGGKLQGNVNSDQIVIKKTANIEGVLNQKTLSIEEGAVLKIKTETYKLF